eukprot:gene9133-6420_t
MREILKRRVAQRQSDTSQTGRKYRPCPRPETPVNRRLWIRVDMNRQATPQRTHLFYSLGTEAASRTLGDFSQAPHQVFFRSIEFPLALCALHFIFWRGDIFLHYFIGVVSLPALFFLGARTRARKKYYYLHFKLSSDSFHFNGKYSIRVHLCYGVSIWSPGGCLTLWSPGGCLTLWSPGGFSRPSTPHLHWVNGSQECMDIWNNNSNNNNHKEILSVRDNNNNCTSQHMKNNAGKERKGVRRPRKYQREIPQEKINNKAWDMQENGFFLFAERRDESDGAPAPAEGLHSDSICMETVHNPSLHRSALQLPSNSINSHYSNGLATEINKSYGKLGYIEAETKEGIQWVSPEEKRLPLPRSSTPGEHASRCNVFYGFKRRILLDDGSENIYCCFLWGIECENTNVSIVDPRKCETYFPSSHAAADLSTLLPALQELFCGGRNDPPILVAGKQSKPVKPIIRPVISNDLLLSRSIMFEGARAALMLLHLYGDTRTPCHGLGGDNKREAFAAAPRSSFPLAFFLFIRFLLRAMLRTGTTHPRESVLASFASHNFSLGSALATACRETTDTIKKCRPELAKDRRRHGIAMTTRIVIKQTTTKGKQIIKKEKKVNVRLRI